MSGFLEKIQWASRELNTTPPKPVGSLSGICDEKGVWLRDLPCDSERRTCMMPFESLLDLPDVKTALDTES